MFFTWWTFLIRVDADFLVTTYLEAISRRVQMVLGKEEFTRDDLINLKGKWRTNARGVYLNVLTSKTRKDWYRTM